MNQAQEEFLIQVVSEILEREGIAESGWYMKQGFIWKYKELGEDNNENEK